MRIFAAIPFICVVSLFLCRSVKSINDTDIDDKSTEEPEDTEATTIDTTITEITEDTKTTRGMTTMTADVSERPNRNSTMENLRDKGNKKKAKVSNKMSSIEETEDHWMKLRSSVHKELMDVQAILVKDEEVTRNCQTANLNATTRYLMCGGSIISDHHVLTSASCLHEATHIRHNIKAPLAIVVGPMKSGSQIIKVQDYVIHPNHQADPYGSNYLKHNLAILKLACRIKAQNLKKVKMPESPFTEICGGENCIVALFRTLGKSSYQVQEVTAEHIPLSKRKRDQNAVLESSTVLNVTDESWIDKKKNLRKRRKLINPPRFGNSFTSIGSHIANQNLRRNSNNADNAKKGDIRSKIVSTTMIAEKNTREIEPMEKIDESIIDNNAVKSVMTRASDYTSRCPRKGSPVMSENVQAAVVSEPCDDRQPSRNWGYTDLFDNMNWIMSMVENWRKPEKLRMGSSINKGSCNTCIFNFYLSKDQDKTYEKPVTPDCNDTISIGKKSNVVNENIAQTVEIRMSNSNNNNNPLEIYSNFAVTSAPALPTAYAAAPLREYRSNTESNSIGPISNNDHRRSTVTGVKCSNGTVNCRPEVDILDKGKSSKIAEMKKESLTPETRDKILLEKMNFFNLKNGARSIKDQSQQDIYGNRQIYSQYFNVKPNIVPEALKTMFARNGGKFENQLPRVPLRPTDNRAMNFQSKSPLWKAVNVTLFNPNLTGLLKDPKKMGNYPEILGNSNTDDSTEDHVIVVKLRIEEPRYDPLKSSSDYIEEARLKNVSIMIDGDRSKNSEIYVNGKSLKNSEIYVYGERARNSPSYEENNIFRSSPKTPQNPQIDLAKKSNAWAMDRIVRFASSTGYATRQERQQSHVARNGTVETRNGDDKGHPGRRMQFSNNVANLASVRKGDLHGLLCKNRQKGKD